MIPNTPEAIGFVSQRLLTHVLPELRTNFGTADLGMLTALLSMVGQDFDRAAQARLDDIREMRALFAGADAVIGDPRLRERSDQACASSLDDLRIAALDSVHDAHSRLLIDMHSRIETLVRANADARTLDEAIWGYYERHAERHRYDIAF